jgi:hypothetical protein
MTDHDRRKEERRKSGFSLNCDLRLCRPGCPLCKRPSITFNRIIPGEKPVSPETCEEVMTPDKIL